MTASRDARRSLIMTSAECVLQAAGPAGMKLRDVARKAGVSPGTIYFYFSSKEELMATMLTSRIDTISEVLSRPGHGATPLDPAQYLAMLMPHITALFRDFEQGLEEWTRAPGDVVAEAVTAQLGVSFTALVTQIVDQFSVAAATTGVTIDQSPESAQFIWTVLIGMAQQEVNAIHASFGTTPEKFTVVAARALVAGLGLDSVASNEETNR